MHRAVLRLAVRGLTECLRRSFPPAALPCLHDLEARSTVLIDAVAAGLPDIDPDAQLLDADGLRRIYDWLFVALATANASDAWAVLACYAVRLHAAANAESILVDLKHAPRTTPVVRPAD